MNSEIVVSTPGKIVISGEYAVLDGASSIVSTLNQRTNISIKQSDKNYNILSTSALESIFPFIIDEDSNIVWCDADPGVFGLLLEHAFNILKPQPTEKFRISVDSSEFFKTTKDGVLYKIGIGSSAAVSVGITKALSQYSDIELPPD